jgi:hypothetical protein
LNWPSSYLFSGSLIVVVIIVFLVTAIRWSEIKQGSYQYRAALIAFAVFCFVIYNLLYMHSLRSDIDLYLMPRAVTQKQVDDLRDYLSHRDKYAVSVKVNPLDAEAREYGAQLFNALNGANWDASFDTSGGDPNTLNDGLCINVIGTNANPYDPKHDPATILQQAFAAARIVANCSGGAGAGNYKLYVLVGHRPLAFGDNAPLLVRVGCWLMNLGSGPIKVLAERRIG